ncbi:hypothetical protein [Fodinibius halophilus]|uniref:Uncharacterized protein n=1 Tax=Fodinibius halophilus TaxID=1736908 RepID=A0A6M1TBD6_9BACT|nr:hypothetical protein [Fodinibius halophilus]NGP88264.1 hypothetical protein [Fodinibius halophilus]
MANSTNHSNHQFPTESDEGHMYIADNKIVYNNRQLSGSSEVNIDQIQYAYVTVDANKQVSLFLFDHHQHYLPITYSGFKKVYRALSSKLGFNDKIFFTYINRQQNKGKKEIWRRTHSTSYKILDSNFNDYDQGFELLSTQPEFILWDTTYEELRSNPNTYFEESPYDQTLLKFRYPVRVGNIQLMNLRAYFNNARTDVPVLHFHTHCRDKSCSDTSYYELKKQLTQDFLPKQQNLRYERVDQNNFCFDANNMLLSLVYTYDSDWQFDRGYTSFSIRNQREYPKLLIDKEYEDNLEVTSRLLIEEPISTSSHYKKNPRVRRRPPDLISNDPVCPVIWFDSKNDKIGFADRSHCQVFNWGKIESFSIQNVLPARGAGRAHLELKLRGGQSHSIFRGQCHVFDPYKEKIAEFTNKVVTTAPESYDC